MMQNTLRFMALVTLATACLLSGCASPATDRNPDGSNFFYSGARIYDGAVWRMEVRNDETSYGGPSLRDRFAHNWTEDAKKKFRWAFPLMAVGDGFSAGLVTISAALVGDGVPILEKGDIVDVFIVASGLDYTEGRASVILQRICAIKDDACIRELRSKQGGKVAGIEIKGVYPYARHRKLSLPLKNVSCAFLKLDCQGELPPPRTAGEVLGTSMCRPRNGLASFQSLETP